MFEHDNGKYTIVAVVGVPACEEKIARAQRCSPAVAGEAEDDKLLVMAAEGAGALVAGAFATGGGDPLGCFLGMGIVAGGQEAHLHAGARRLFQQ